LSTLLVAWAVFPLLLAVLCAGCGLLVEAAAGERLPSASLLPVGFALVVVACLFTTSLSFTARLTVPLVVVLAVAGFVLSRRQLVPRLRPDRWAGGGALLGFAAVGAPVLLSGSATYTGYITLDDTASWLGFVDRLLTHGRNLGGLQPSTYEVTLHYYWIQYGYPVGIYPPLGIGRVLLGTDPAWLFQPYLAFLAAMIALALYSVCSGLIASRPLRALTAGIAAQPALLYGYSQWGGIKELGTAAMLVLIAALAPPALRRDAPLRTLVPVAVSSAALIGILNVSAGIWLAPALLPVLALGVQRNRRAFLRPVVAYGVLTALLSIPSLWLADSFTSDIGLNSKGGDIGNLITPLSWLQMFGIWPAGDFRVGPTFSGPTHVLIALVALAGVAGVVWSLRRGLLELPVLASAGVIGCILGVHFGSAWIGAKSLAIASPVPIVAAMAGACWLLSVGRRVEGSVVLAAIVGGVLWSNTLAYHDVWLAPRGQLSELETIGHRFAGDGPALMTEYQPAGVRHFLRGLDAEGASELRYRPVLLQNGQEVAKGGYADIDDFQLSAVLVYRTLVLDHSASASRPPSIYKLVWSGKWYDVWQRPVSPGAKILQHLSLGTDEQPSAVPTCSSVVALGRVAAAVHGRIAAVPRPLADVVPLSQGIVPPDWQTFAASPEIVYPSRSGTLGVTATATTAGRYGLWLAGSFRRRLSVAVDGHHVGTFRQQLNHPGDYTLLGYVQLSPGSHVVTLDYSAANLSPGSGGASFAIGPLVVSRVTDQLPVEYVNPSAARSLCGKPLDWVEAVTA
jgi:hypothetical protein